MTFFPNLSRLRVIHLDTDNRKNHLSLLIRNQNAFALKREHDDSEL